MSQILDKINNHTRVDLWNISHVEPDPAVVLELQPTVSLVHVLWAQSVPEVLQSRIHNFRGKDITPASQKPLISTSPILTSDLNRTCTDWCICTAAHHNALAVPLSYGEIVPGLSCWGWWKLGCKTTLQKISPNTNSPPQILSSQPASPPCVLT